MKQVNKFIDHGILAVLLSFVSGIFFFFVSLGASLIVSWMTTDFTVYDFLYNAGFFAVLFLTLVLFFTFVTLRLLGVFSISAFCRKISEKIKVVFGWGVAVSLFAGGVTILGFLAAFIIGGETATNICLYIQKQIFPIIIYISTVMVLLGLCSMYFEGEKALTSDTDKEKEHEGER